MTRGALLFIALGAASCYSPEADRKRGGDPGADPGNRDPVVEIHQGAEPYHDTPCRLVDEECPEPKPSPATAREKES